VIGLAAGTVCFAATHYMKRALKVDDSLDVFPVHGVGGMLGTLAAGVFASTELGVFSGQGYAEGMGMGSQMLVQVTGVAAVAAYTGVVTFVLLKAVDYLTGLRVSAEHETLGLDQAEHNERGYNL
jgi:ammonium transporter, Amt family